MKTSKIPRPISRPQQRVSKIPRPIKSFDENCRAYRASLAALDPFNDHLRYTCDMIPMSKVRFVYGPITYREYINGDKRIGIFGEEHFVPVNKTLDIRNTVSAPSLLKMILLANPTKVYDFFLETPYLSPLSTRSRFGGSSRFGGWFESGITSFNHVFGDCLKVVKGDCPFPNLRAHYVDYRNVIDVEYENYISLLFKSATTAETDLSKIGVDKLTDDFIYAYEYVVRVIDTDPKIQKEIRGIKGQIQSFVSAKLAAAETDFRKSKVLGRLQDMILRIIDLHVLLMDVYTLGRLFKPFATNSIIYVGNAHADNYCEFLELEMGFTRVVNLTVNKDRLLDFRGVKRFLIDYA